MQNGDRKQGGHELVELKLNDPSYFQGLWKDGGRNVSTVFTTTKKKDTSSWKVDTGNAENRVSRHSFGGALA